MKLWRKKYKEIESIEDEKKKYKEESSISFKEIIDGSILIGPLFRKQMLVIVLIFILCLVYITLRNYAEESYNMRLKLSKEVKDLRYESISVDADLMFIGKQSEVKKRVQKENLGLKVSKEPPIKIYKE